MKIHDMNISARAKSCLIREGYSDSSQIRDLSDTDFLSIKNLNQKCLDEIRQALFDDNQQDEYIIENDILEKSEDACKSESVEGNYKVILFKVLDSLTEREKSVLILRYGLLDGNRCTLEEIGEEFNVTRERVRQIEAKALRKLRHPSRSKQLKQFVDGDADIIELLNGFVDKTIDVINGYPNHVKKIVRDKCEYWEYRLYTEALIVNFEWFSGMKNRGPLWENEYGDVDISEISELMSFISDKLKRLIKMSDDIDSIYEKVVEGIGKPGEPGDENLILYATNALGFVYLDLINWMNEFYQVETITLYHKVIEEIFKIGDGLFESFESLHQKAIGVKNSFDDYFAGKIKEDEIKVDLSLEYSYDMDGFRKAMKEIEPSYNVSDDDYEDDEYDDDDEF